MKLTTSKFYANCADYLCNALYERQDNLDKAQENLSDVKFDTIVCTGVSGLVFAPILAYVMKKQLVVIRKGRDGSHSRNRVEANCKPENIGRWIFVDDLVCSGATRKRVKLEISRHVRTAMKADRSLINTAVYVGEYLYACRLVWKPAREE